MVVLSVVVCGSHKLWTTTNTLVYHIGLCVRKEGGGGGGGGGREEREKEKGEFFSKVPQ